MRFFVVVLSLSSLLTACVHRPMTPAPYHNAYVNETIEIELGSAKRSQFVAALRSSAMQVTTSMRGGINLVPSFAGPAQSVAMPSNALNIALTDAQHKAEVVAKRLQLGLGPVESVTEQLAGASPNGLKGGVPPTQSMVRSLGGQPLVLNVVYRLGTSDRFISVFGVGSGEAIPPEGSIRTVRVFVTGSGTTLAVATSALEYYEAVVRRTAKSLSLPADKVTIIDGSFSAD